MIRGVIFDMDGLLADSERLAMAVCVEAGNVLGYPVTMELALRTLGRTRASCDAIYSEAIPGFVPEAFYSVYDDLFFRRVEEEGVPLKSGALLLLDFMEARGLPGALASSSRMRRIRACLDRHGVLPRFRAVVSGEHIRNSKPAPDIFLEAARQLGVAPGNCLALEDSKYGLMAARAAGMRVCMVPDLLPYTEELAPYCDHVVAGLSGVIPLLGS